MSHYYPLFTEGIQNQDSVSLALFLLVALWIVGYFALGKIKIIPTRYKSKVEWVYLFLGVTFHVACLAYFTLVIRGY